MKKAEIQKRINNALENELGKIYDELGVSSGDISPTDLLEWDLLAEDMATLFQALIAWNTEKE